MTIFITLLLIASAVAMATKWVRVPYTLALTIVGLGISPMHLLPPVHLSPDLILIIFLPALLFEAAWNNGGHTSASQSDPGGRGVACVKKALKDYAITRRSLFAGAFAVEGSEESGMWRPGFPI